MCGSTGHTLRTLSAATRPDSLLLLTYVIYMRQHIHIEVWLAGSVHRQTKLQYTQAGDGAHSMQAITTTHVTCVYLCVPLLAAASPPCTQH